MLVEVALDRRLIGEDLWAALSILLDRQIILRQELAEFRVYIRTHFLHLLRRRSLSLLEPLSTLEIIRHHLADLNTGLHELFHLSRFCRKAGTREQQDPKVIPMMLRARSMAIDSF